MTDKGKLQLISILLAKKYDKDFDYEVDHWEWNNSSDSLSYGIEIGCNNTYKELIDFIEDLNKGDTE